MTGARDLRVPQVPGHSSEAGATSGLLRSQSIDAGPKPTESGSFVGAADPFARPRYSERMCSGSRREAVPTVVTAARTMDVPTAMTANRMVPVMGILKLSSR